MKLNRTNPWHPSNTSIKYRPRLFGWKIDTRRVKKTSGSTNLYSFKISEAFYVRLDLFILVTTGLSYFFPTISIFGQRWRVIVIVLGWIFGRLSYRQVIITLIIIPPNFTLLHFCWNIYMSNFQHCWRQFCSQVSQDAQGAVCFEMKKEIC